MSRHDVCCRRTNDCGSRGWGFESSWAHKDLAPLVGRGRPRARPEFGVSLALGARPGAAAAVSASQATRDVAPHAAGDAHVDANCRCALGVATHLFPQYR